MPIGSAPGDLVASLNIDPSTDAVLSSVGVGTFSVQQTGATWRFHLTGAATQPGSALTAIATITGGLIGSPFRVALLDATNPSTSQWTVYLVNPANGYPQSLPGGVSATLHVAFYRATPNV